MGLIDKLRGTEGGVKSPARPERKAPAKSIVAAAMPMSGPGVTRINRGRSHVTQEQWQTEAWYYFDVIGEARSAMVWIANAVSQADIHATTLDPDTGKPTGPSENPSAQAVANQVLGGPQLRAGHLRTLALCWQVAGEAWIIIRPDKRPGKPDQWLVLSGQKVNAKGESWQYTDPYTLELVTLGLADRLIRVWCPHPNDQSKADSAMRPALPILRELEKVTQNIAARLDSRIATNGLMALAEELDFPKGDFETSAAAFMDFFMQATEAGLQNPGQASSQVPLAFTAPAEHIANGGAFAHYDISTEFDQSIVELRDNNRDRLAQTLDMPKSTAQGTQNEANHWSAWQVSEDTYKIFIEPLLKAIGDPISVEWMVPALKLMGVPDEEAEREEIGWDTTAIVARPDDTENLRDLHDRLLISDEYMLAENGVPEDAKPSEKEYTKRYLEKVILAGVPASLLADPNVATVIGLQVEIAPVAAGVDGEVSSSGELEAPAPEPTNVRALPTQGSPAPGDNAVPEGLVAAAELIVYDALSRAGGRLLTNQNRGQFKATPRHELHTVIDVSDPLVMMEGSFEFTDAVAQAFGQDPARFRDSLRAYTGYLLKMGAEHDRALLSFHLRKLW